MELEIVLSMKGDAPIYEQIESQIRTQIFSGKLAPGQAIPSMRALAKMLRVSVITVQKAYENLKREGLIESAVGRGTIVASVSHEMQREEKRREMEESLEKAVSLSKACGVSREEMHALLDCFYEE